MIAIYHNPDCGTSRNTLRLIESSGADLTVVEYLDVGWTKAQLVGLFTAANLTPRDALRVVRSPAESLGLTDPSTTDEELLAAMVSHPVLVNRPIVCSPKGVRLCRPCERVLDLLDVPPKLPFYKDNGELLIDADGSLVKPD
ncbi:MAG: arsenate reductase (glutaredoxin) [Pseudomonadota bacterium]